MELMDGNSEEDKPKGGIKPIYVNGLIIQAACAREKTKGV